MVIPPPPSSPPPQNHPPHPWDHQVHFCSCIGIFFFSPSPPLPPSISPALEQYSTVPWASQSELTGVNLSGLFSLLLPLSRSHSLPLFLFKKPSENSLNYWQLLFRLMSKISKGNKSGLWHRLGRHSYITGSQKEAFINMWVTKYNPWNLGRALKRHSCDETTRNRW